MREPIVLLDGAMATELAARGFDLRAPLFSARALIDAPELVVAIHDDYLRAGAQVLTTNSFGLHASTLALAGVAERQAELARRAVELLEQVRWRALAEERKLARFRIAGSIPPRPRGSSTDPALAQAEYRCLAEQLALAGADLILFETFTTIAEAELALAGVAGLDLPIWLSVVAGAPPSSGTRPDGARLIEGDPIAELARLSDRVDALLINCTQIDAVPAARRALLASDEPIEVPLGLAPHFGKRRHDGVWIDRIVESDVFAEQIEAWLTGRGARAAPGWCLAGACCGSKPADIAALRARLQPDEAARERAWTRLAELIP